MYTYVVFIYTELYVHIIHFDNQFWPETSEQLTRDLHRFLVTTALLDTLLIYKQWVADLLIWYASAQSNSVNVYMLCLFILYCMYTSFILITFCFGGVCLYGREGLVRMSESEPGLAFCFGGVFAWTGGTGTDERGEAGFRFLLRRGMFVRTGLVRMSESELGLAFCFGGVCLYGRGRLVWTSVAEPGLAFWFGVFESLFENDQLPNVVRRPARKKSCVLEPGVGKPVEKTKKSRRTQSRLVAEANYEGTPISADEITGSHLWGSSELAQPWMATSKCRFTNRSRSQRKHIVIHYNWVTRSTNQPKGKLAESHRSTSDVVYQLLEQFQELSDRISPNPEVNSEVSRVFGRRTSHTSVVATSTSTNNAQSNSTGSALRRFCATSFF